MTATTTTEVRLPETLVRVMDEHPLPEGYTYSYGTAGFRTLGNRIPPVAARMAALVYLKAMATSRPTPRRMGVMITASHNSAEDNGLKIIDLDGGMLDMKWEHDATAFANAPTGAVYLAAVQRLVDEMGNPQLAEAAKTFRVPTPEELVVVIGSDTRPSSTASVKALTQAFDALGVAYKNLGLVTTPEVHHEVYYGADTLPWDATIANTFAKLVEILPESVKQHKRFIAVDCANGVGSDSLPRVLKLLEGTEASKLHSIALACTATASPHLLNEKCGADFAQKTQKPSELMHETVERQFAEAAAASGAKEQQLGVYSIDGDADRLVGFDCIRDGKLMDAGKGLLLDGDRQIALIAMTVKDIAAGLPESFKFTTGVVQTAYANGGSTKFIRDVLGLNIVIAATGVKYTHHEAAHYDIGIYFEANGHGTLLIDENGRHPAAEARDDRLVTRLRQLARSSDEHGSRVANELLMFGTLLSQSCGDAIANLFAIEYCLRRLGLTFKSWLSMYRDLPSKQIKVQSSNHRVVTTIRNETRATAPAGLQEAVDNAVRVYGGADGRAFVRPSGTEPIIRVYAEAATEEECDKLTQAVVDAVKRFAP